ncbi:MAG: hypothetical protein Q8R55_05095 [Candidatus Taylorbacteria bacterium]|nr:hypothetical protein [Candidatus Taylorbacteria bacterium]
MAITNFSTKYRTLKIAFLIPEGDIKSLTEAVKINTLLWGGEHNPIIPVGSNTTEVIDFINSSPIDVLHPVVHSEEIDVVIHAFPFLKSPHHFTYEMFREDWHSKKQSPVYLDSLNIIEKHYHRYFKGTPQKEGGSNCVLPKWSDEDPLSNVFSLTFGNYKNNFNLQDDFENAFIKGLRAKKIDIEKDKKINAEIANKISPITLTSLELKNYRSELLRDGGVFLGSAESFEDLVFYWNLRATGLWIEFLPIEAYERYAEFINRHIENLAKSTKKPDFHRSIIFYYRNITDEIINPIFDKFKKEGVPLYKSNISHFSLSKLLQHLPTDTLGWEFTNGLVEKSYGKYVVNVNLPEKKFISTESERDVSKQSLAVSIDSFSDFGFGGYTLKLPYIRSLNEFYSREIGFEPWKIRSEEDSIAVIVELDDKTETLYPIEHQVLIDKVFDHVGITTKKSQAGLLTKEIISSMREDAPIEACRVFKITGVRKLIKTLKVDDYIDYSSALKIIGQNSFSKHKGLFIESRNEKDLTVQNVFDYLIKKRILKPKLRFYEKFFRKQKDFRCSKCGLSSNIRYVDFEDYWTCEYCEHKQYMPSFIASEFKDRSCWKFKKRGLFGKENNQEGALPVILTMLVFKHVFSSGTSLYSTSMRCEGCDKKPEIDFAILQYGFRNNKIELAFGECKSDGGEITADDIDKLKSVKEKFEPKGIKCHFVFAKTAEEFSDNEINLFKKLWSEDHSLILFLNKELETNHHLYWDDEDVDRLPFKYALSFRELGQNSHFRYLQNHA